MKELTGWLLDVYPEAQAGVTLWLVGQDGQRYRLQQPFPVTFYASGPSIRLRLLWRYLQAQSVLLTLSRTERRDLFAGGTIPVLAIQLANPAAQPALFQQITEAFPDLSYFDADIPLALRYAAKYDLFPLAHCQATIDEDCRIQHIQPLDTPWKLNPLHPPLRVLYCELDADPARQAPRHLNLRFGQLGNSPGASYRLALQPERPLLVNLRAILLRHDPDLLLTTWGDTWLLPRLLDLSNALGLPLPLNRDTERQPAHHPERSYFSYGQVIYRGRQVHLFGRCHIDRGNAMLWDDYDLEGVMEVARVTSLPLQTAARVSPGSGISAMQMLTALRQEVLVPWHKQQVERPKTALEMFAADQGGMVYQPLIGLHGDVGGIDFVSMYPGIMVRFNISPETVQGQRPNFQDLTRIERLAAEELRGAEEQPGLIPLTLAPLLEKRVTLKSQLAVMPRWDPRRQAYQARASAHKWLLVTCFGYLGYKNARFGRIEAHEAVTAYGREALLRAKEVAEDLGFTVLHLYVDGLWVKKPGAKTVDDFQALLDEISRRTHLPIALDGVYRWVAFLPSRVNKRVPVANRYFGVFQDGSLKVRGIEARRGDTPAFIVETQMQMLELLAQEQSAEASRTSLSRPLALLRRRLAELRSGRVPAEALLVAQKLSRELEEYRARSPVARAVEQLQSAGKSLRPGQSVRFVYTRGKPGVRAWDLPEPPDPATIDIQRYTTLLLRAAHTILEPFGLPEEVLPGLARPLPARQLTLSAKSVRTPLTITDSDL